jgi:hypothetical protein
LVKKVNYSTLIPFLTRPRDHHGTAVSTWAFPPNSGNQGAIFDYAVHFWRAFFRAQAPVLASSITTASVADNSKRDRRNFSWDFSVVISALSPQGTKPDWMKVGQEKNLDSD